MSIKYLTLWFEAPMQSWGFDSLFGRRTTLDFPTKSGIYGILLSALGKSGDQVELLESLSRLKQTVISYLPEKQTASLPQLMDFHMVGSGYDSSDDWQSQMIPKTNEGKSAVGGGAKMTYRYYLQDRKFAIVQEIDSEMEKEMQEGLSLPVYDIFLGRKSCIPTDFVFKGIYKDFEKAIAVLDEIMKEKKLHEEFRVLDGEHEGDSFTLNDIPVSFGPNKVYRDRRVTVVR